MQKSFGLIEVIVSIIILTLGIGGAIVVLNNIVNHFRLATDVFVANSLAVEGVEIVRNIRDNNLLATPPRGWNHGLAVGNHQVSFNDTVLTAHTDGILNISIFFQHSPGNPTPFRRRIEIVDCPGIANCLEIRSIVTWTDIIGNQRVVVVTRLFEGRHI